MAKALYYGSFFGVKKVIIGKSVKQIGDYAFVQSQIESISIPDNILSLGKYAFADNYNLRNIRLSNSLEKIDEGTFQNCINLTEITIPESVNSIAEGAFAGCTNLQSFRGKFASEDGRCLIVDGVLVAFAPAGLTEYKIPLGVTRCGDFAFYGCNELTKVIVPQETKRFGKGARFHCDTKFIRGL